MGTVGGIGKMDMADLGEGTVERLTAKAALIDLENHLEQQWVPFSVMSTPTAAAMVEGDTLDSVRVETWFALKEGLM